jgi:voltage-gated potassium channel
LNKQADDWQADDWQAGDWRQHVEGALEGHHGRLGRAVVLFIYALIAISVISIGIETIDGLPIWLADALTVIEWVTVAVFTVEYILRIAIAPSKRAYIFSFWGIVDLLAILPFYLSFGVDLRAIRVVRLFRVFRLLKMARYSDAAERLANAFRAVREELIVFGITATVTLYICAVCIYSFEHEAQPDKFRSIFDALWWASVTLTTVGYGDRYPITVGGRIFTMLMLFVALGVIAVPTGLVSSALSRMRHKSEEHHDEQRDGHHDEPAKRG